MTFGNFINPFTLPDMMSSKKNGPNWTVQYYHYACCTKSFSLNDYSVFNESIRIKDDATVKVMVTKLRLTKSSLTI